MIQRVLRALAGLIGLLLLLMGLSLLFTPARQAAQFAVFPSGNAGLSTLRGDLGGLFLGMGAFALLGAIRASSRWLSVTAVFLGLIAFGRIVNLSFDGRSSEGTQALVLELGLIAVLLVTMLSLRRGQPRVRGFGLAIAVSALFVLVLGIAFFFQRQIFFGHRVIAAIVPCSRPRDLTRLSEMTPSRRAATRQDRARPMTVRYRREY